MARSRGEEGFALVTALWAALILAIVVSYVVRAGRVDARIVHTARQQAEAAALAKGALALVELRLLDPVNARFIPVDGTPFSIDEQGRSIGVSVQDQAGLIDVNFASEDTLRRLFHGAGGFEEADADALTDKILDWREHGAGRRLNGAKASEYAAAGLAYGPRQGPFESVAELGLVLDLAPTTFNRVAAAMTVYSQKPLIDPQVAPDVVLAVLPGMDEQSASLAIQEREQKHEENGTEGTPGLPLVGRSFRISVQVPAKSGPAFKADRVIRLTGFEGSPIWTYQSS